MSLITWTDDLSVKVAQIDTQHKKLVDLINSLHLAMKQRKADEALGGVIESLVNYAIEHFRTEEKYFDEFDYLEGEQHKKEHMDFVYKVAAFKNDFDRGKMMLPLEIMEFLKDWFINHVKKTDMAYSDFFVKKGLS